MSAPPLEPSRFDHLDSAGFTIAIKNALNTPDRSRPVGLVLCEPREARAVELVEFLGPRFFPHLQVEDHCVVLNGDILAFVRPAINAPAETEAFGRRVHQAAIGWADDESLDHSFSTAATVSLGDDSASTLLNHADHALDQARQLGPNAFVAFDDLDRMDLKVDF